jgi:histidyl-tRNA synthetase
VGISFGLDRVTEFSQVRVESTKVIVISLDKDSEAIKLARELRKSSVSCIFTNDKPGKALEYANSLQIPFAIFIGAEEIEKKKFKLKDMKSGEERYISETQLIKALAK